MQQITLRLNQTFQDIYFGAANRASDLLPRAILAVLFIAVGWLGATIARWVTVQVLGFFAVDKLSAKTPLSSLLKSIGITRSVSEILGTLVFWGVMLFTLIFAADKLHLTQVSFALAIIAGFIPRIIAAVLVIIVGMLLAKFLQMLTVQTLGHANINHKKIAGRAVQAVVLVFVFTIAIDQLGVELSSAINAVVILGSVLLLIIGLAFAVGARTFTDNCVSCRQLRRQLTEGSTVTIGTLKARVKGFTLTSVILESGTDTMVMPANDFFVHTYTIHAS